MSSFGSRMRWLYCMLVGMMILEHWRFMRARREFSTVWNEDISLALRRRRRIKISFKKQNVQSPLKGVVDG
jgi:hypothetical protein